MNRKRRDNNVLSGHTFILGITAVLIVVFLSMYFLSSDAIDYKPSHYNELISDSKYYAESEITDWHKIDLGPFSLEAPKDYLFFKIQGVDSYIAGLTNFKDTLIFDYGWYSNELGKYSGKNYLETNEAVNGRQFKLIREDNQIGFVGAYTEDLEKDNRLSIVCFNCRDLEQKIEMFRTIEFK